MAVEWDGSLNRRLPVYLLLDCSSSMAGVKIQQVNTGVQMLYQELMADPRSADTVWVSIISFGSSVTQLDLVPIVQFTPPQLTANGGRSFGAALSLLNRSLDSDIIPNQAGRKGDYAPLVFILTDGKATDAWQTEAHRLKSRTTSRPASIIALAIGNDADTAMLKQVASHVFDMGNMISNNLESIFEWRSQPLTVPHVFVSHSHSDKPFTARLVGDLRSAGARVWVDDADMHPGEFPQQISDALAAAEWVIVVLTPSSAASRWVRREVDAGIARMDHDLLKGVIPIMVAHTDPGDIPPLWLNLHCYDATRDYDAALHGVLRAIGLC